MVKKKIAWHHQKVTASAFKRNPTGGVPGSNSGIQGDDVGIFVTCDKGREGKCVGEVVDLLGVAATELGYIDDAQVEEDRETSGNLGDIEASIAAELDGLKPGKKEAGKGKKDTFRAVRLDVPCVSFIKIAPPLDPVKLVHHICSQALSSQTEKRSRYVKRMSPMTLMKKTLSGGLETLCDDVLGRTFRGGVQRKYAIRPTVRNNDQLNRDVVIKTVADWVGKDHIVDLKGYDVLILVDVYRNVCGMSVIGSDFEKFKRFNLAEIYDPTPTSEKAAVPVAGKEKERDKPDVSART